MAPTSITPEIIASHGLTKKEYSNIIKHLEREPNGVELGVFSVMWSEHCSYKSSKIHLKKFPTYGPKVVQGPGENAGVVDIGDNQVAVFKMESHNHPSFIEPYQGAATGVGGILRDVFTMGARPVALLNSLRFGDPHHPKTKFLVDGVVRGIGGYGNCFGCPTVGGEVYFHESYNLNPLVNAFCLGIAEKDKIFLGRAEGVGNPVIYVGSKTGRDGIHGATMASQEFDDKALSKRPTVQVGDPFTEKLLLEACLEVMKENYVVGIQDMGAAGLTSSSVEMAGRSGNGILIDLSKIPARETNMTPYEFLLSESQERMLLVVKKGYEKHVQKIFSKWDLDMAVIGKVTGDGRFRAKFKGKEVANIPVKALTEAAPMYERPVRAPEHTQQIDFRGEFLIHSERLSRRASGPGSEGTCPERERARELSANFSLGKFDAGLEELIRNSPEDMMKMLVSSPNLCSRRWIYRQYDHQVRGDSVILPGGDAAVIRLKGTQKGLAITIDCNSVYCKLDPYLGAQMAVCEAARNLACVGATPIGLTDCLNFGNPEKPEIMWQFQKSVEGIAEACRYFNIPVVSGNVSLYNETNGESIYPTPTIGMVGLLSDIDLRVTHGFKQAGDVIVLLGESLSSLNLELEKKVQEVLLELISKKIISSAHDCSEGGLAMALLESCFENNLGAKIQYVKKGISGAVWLFNEAPSRVIVSISQDHLQELKTIVQKHSIPYCVLGEVTSNRQFVVTMDPRASRGNDNDTINMDLESLKKSWENAFEKLVH